MNNKLKNNSFIILFLIIVVMYFYAWFLRFGGNNICSDGVWYYEYFIRLFINHDLDGSGLIKFPIGTMILQLPFLFVAWLYSILLGIDLEGGLSLPFQRAVFFAALFYYIIAIIMIYKMLKKLYSEKVSVLTCLCLTFGTMIPVYICEKSSYSHIYGFFICTLFFCYIDYYELKRTKQNAILMDLLLGALLGYAAIIRNTNVIIGAVYLFYNVHSLKTFFKRIVNNIIKPKIVLQILGFIFIYSIQIIFWKKMTGEWILYSYGEETFSYISNPQILSVWFSDAKGLFIYCPILIVSIISMILFGRENKKYQLSQWIIFASVTYFIAAWWCWWLGSAYGERMYCDVLCIFSIPLASFFHNLNEWSHKTKTIGKYSETIHIYVPSICYIIIIFLIMLNLIWINGTRSGSISDNFGTWYELKNHFYNYLIK